MFERIKNWVKKKREYYGYYLRGDTPAEKKYVRIFLAVMAAMIISPFLCFAWSYIVFGSNILSSSWVFNGFIFSFCFFLFLFLAACRVWDELYDLATMYHGLYVKHENGVYEYTEGGFYITDTDRTVKPLPGKAKDYERFGEGFFIFKGSETETEEGD